MSQGWMAGALGALVMLGAAGRHLEGQRRWSAHLAVGHTAGTGAEFDGAPGSIAAIAGVSLAPSRHFVIGMCFGEHSLGTSTSVTHDNIAPGSVQRESYARTLWEWSLSACRRSPFGALRLETCLGAGPYLYRRRDEIVTRDSTSASIPGYDFLQTRSDVQAGFHVAIAVDRPRAFGHWGIGAEGAYHQAAVLGGHGFVTIALRLTLN